MLRCPPSRINLTSNDIAEFEHRFIARHGIRKSDLSNYNVRLSPGPGRQASHSLVSEDRNPGRKRADSVASHATICSTEHPGADERPVTFVQESSENWTATTPSNVASRPSDQSALTAEAVRALESVVSHRQSSRPSPGRSTLPHSPAAAVTLSSPLHDDAPVGDQQPCSTLDGTADFDLTDPPLLEPQPALATPSSSRTAVTPARNVLPRFLSSARARRRNARSHDIPIHEDSEELQQFIIERHHERIPSSSRHFDPDLPPPVPELMLPEDMDEVTELPNPALDPGAPVFIPRTRFGAATGSSDAGLTANLGGQWSSLDSTHSSSNLRLRSNSEQNVDPPFHRRPNVGNVQGEAAVTRQRRRSRTSDQNQPLPNLERYPLLRPPTARSNAHRRNSGSFRPVPVPGRRASRLPSVSTLRQMSSASAASDSTASIVARPVRATVDVSTNNLLTPYGDREPSSEPRISARSSSLAWSQASPARRAPSITSGASGISGLLSSRASSAEGLNATAEFFRMRNSPLDELTEHLSRLAANRPRSVGRSWERPLSHRGRMSLLNGDPFRQSSSPEPDEFAGEPRETGARMRSSKSGHRATLIQDAIPEFAPPPETIELPASPVEQSSPDVSSSTPLPRHVAATHSSPRSRLADLSPRKAHARTPSSGIRRKPMPSGAATPKVRVYNDGEPPNIQPQTTADLIRPGRHGREHPTRNLHQHSISLAGSLTASPPAIPERHVHRNTYPSATPPPQTPHLSTSAPSPYPATLSLQESARRAQIRRRAGAQSSSEENELEGHVHELEAEHQVWVSRREAGTLDTTPPSVGRFEGYLV